ncbi:unnamed protein product, partial [Vitis vinifera]|uniref:Uncharacterized protein n=1 Tax=Vitis vinifera TaxID=29760 RepID=D7T4V7_VITVI
MSPAATNPKAGWEVPFKYVVELARGSVPGVHHVYLLARQVLSLDVDWSYINISRKNITTLVKAFRECWQLREPADLMVLRGSLKSDVCTVHCAFGCLLLSGHVGDFAVYCTLLAGSSSLFAYSCYKKVWVLLIHIMCLTMFFFLIPMINCLLLKLF